MKKPSAFITKGVENVVPVLEAVNSAADAFPPLKSTIGGALFLLNAYKDFKSNQEDWKAFGNYVSQAVACVSAAVSQSGNPAPFEQALNDLKRTLDATVAETQKARELQASMGRFRKFMAFLKDRNVIPALEMEFKRALSNFHLGANIEARNKLAETFTDMQGLVAGVSVLASNVKQIERDSTLRQLKVADGASWNKQKACQEKTRTELLTELEEFASARDPSSAERVLLLTGVAGCGKTAIAQSVAERLSEHSWPDPRLGACFNFSAQVEDRRTPRLLFSTLAFSLSATDPILETSIVDALSEDRTLPSAPLATQFDGLIRAPLSTLPNPPPHPTVLILDALDEISDKDGLEDLLKLLADDFSRLPASCRVIITSRPDPTIIHWLESAIKPHIVRRQIQHKDPASLKDLGLVARTRLQQIASGRNLGDSWPESELEKSFVRKAGGLFVWLDVACRAINKSARPTKELHRLLASDDVESGMTQLYSRILDGCPWDKRVFSSNYPLILGTLVALKTPLSANAIAELVGSLMEAEGEVEDVLEPLASVVLGVSTLATDSSPAQSIEISHESFREFVTTTVPEDKRNYAVDELESSRRLALQCLRVLNDELPQHANMLREFFPDSREGRDIPSPGKGVVSEVLGYACDHWVAHLSVIETPAPELLDALRQFLRASLIPWMQLCASRGQFQGVDRLRKWLNERPLNVPHSPEVHVVLDFGSEVDLKHLAQCLDSVQAGLVYMRRLEEALVACRTWVAVERQLVEREPTFSNAGLATSLYFLSTRLLELGGPEDALKAIEEGVEKRRKLATDTPAPVKVDLGAFLGTLSACLSALGRREEALGAIGEAVKIHRQLAAEDPDEFIRVLSISLRALSNCLSAVGQREAALNAIEEGVRIRRQLAAKIPTPYNADLGAFVGTLSSCLSALGRLEEALNAVEEAVGIHRQLAKERPAAFIPVLATSLRDHSNFVSQLGRQEEALSVIEEAVTIHRQLASQRPNASNPGLALSLINLSKNLGELGRQEEALNVIEEAVTTYRKLASERPDAFNPNFAVSLINMSGILSELGRQEEALSVIEEAVTTYRQPAFQRPNASNPALARSLSKLSECLDELEREEEALDVIEEAITIYRQLASERPDAYDLDLAVSLYNLSVWLSQLGRQDEALGAIEEAVTFYRKLMSEYPARFAADLADALDLQADRLAEMGRDSEAERIREERAALMH